MSRKHIDILDDWLTKRELMKEIRDFRNVIIITEFEILNLKAYIKDLKKNLVKLEKELANWKEKKEKR